MLNYGGSNKPIGVLKTLWLNDMQEPKKNIYMQWHDIWVHQQTIPSASNKITEKDFGTEPNN